jgi:hypothetical protein
MLVTFRKHGANRVDFDVNVFAEVLKHGMISIAFLSHILLQNLSLP